MKVIIAGSRTINDKSIVAKAVYESKLRPYITEIISGGARGIDKFGEQYAEFLNIPLKIFPANWNKYGKKAGYLRNLKMANYADALIAIWDGKSKGTKHMIDIAKKKRLETFIYLLK